VLDDAAILARVKEIDPFRMAVPAAWGGTETDICKPVEIIETVARCFPSLCVDGTFGTSITLQGEVDGIGLGEISRSSHRGPLAIFGEEEFVLAYRAFDGVHAER